MHRPPVEEEDAAALHGDGEAAGAADRLRDAQVERLPRPGGAVGEQPAAVTLRDDAEAAVLHRGLEDGEPDGEHLRPVHFRQGHALVLVPLHRADHRVALAQLRTEQRLGGFDAHVLDGIGEHLGADQPGDGVHQAGRGDQVEDGRAGVHRAVQRLVGRHLPREADVERPVAGGPGVVEDAGEPLRERQIGVRRAERPRRPPLVGDRVEQGLVLPHHRVEVQLRVEQSLDQQVPLVCEAFNVHPWRRCCGHALSPRGLNSPAGRPDRALPAAPSRPVAGRRCRDKGYLRPGGT